MTKTYTTSFRVILPVNNSFIINPGNIVYIIGKIEFISDNIDLRMMYFLPKLYFQII